MTQLRLLQKQEAMSRNSFLRDEVSWSGCGDEALAAKGGHERGSLGEESLYNCFYDEKHTAYFS